MWIYEQTKPEETLSLLPQAVIIIVPVSAATQACFAARTGSRIGTGRAIAAKRAPHPGKAARHPGLLAAGCGFSAGMYGSRSITGGM